MAQRVTFFLDEDVIAFVKKAGGKDMSAYLNGILKKKKQKVLQKALLKANQEEADDVKYHNELSGWDETLSDGLNF